MAIRRLVNLYANQMAAINVQRQRASSALADSSEQSPGYKLQGRLIPVSEVEFEGINLTVKPPTNQWRCEPESIVQAGATYRHRSRTPEGLDNGEPGPEHVKDKLRLPFAEYGQTTRRGAWMTNETDHRVSAMRRCNPYSACRARSKADSCGYA